MGGIQEGSSHEFSQKQDMPSWRRGYIFDMHCSPEQAEGLAPGFVFQMITYLKALGGFGLASPC